MTKAEQIAQQYTREQLWQRFDKLPDNVQTLLLSPETSATIERVARDNGVPSKVSKIIRYVDFILAGIMPITLLRETLEQELSISTESARKIAMEIRDKIFMGVKDELREIHNLK